ncbi:unnamed protein product [Ranitomeya imitator]|uniref:DnaJ homologue subfamily C GRV2/DNAJC13 N-terminal domain-containing protein n=1 Tax=Ranitomeya imitator TaxID=111125 RepID=A0ABN9LH60_9NEOB|nr:unnamed protein product [Ranitomeya imitator]
MVSNLPPDMVSNLPPDMVSNLPPDMVSNLPPDMVSNLPPDMVSNLSPDMVSNLPPDMVSNLPPDMVSNLPPDMVSNLPPDMVSNLPPDMVSNLPPDQNVLPLKTLTSKNKGTAILPLVVLLELTLGYRHTKRFTYDHDQRYDLAVIVDKPPLEDSERRQESGGGSHREHKSSDERVYSLLGFSRARSGDLRASMQNEYNSREQGSSLFLYNKTFLEGEYMPEQDNLALRRRVLWRTENELQSNIAASMQPAGKERVKQTPKNPASMAENCSLQIQHAALQGEEMNAAFSTTRRGDSANCSAVSPAADGNQGKHRWPYGDICGISPVGKGQGSEFALTFRKGSGKKSETLKFSTEHRTELLTEALRYNCYKHHWSDDRKLVTLEVTPGGIDQIDPTNNRVLCSYDYRNIEGFAELSDYQGGFCILYGGFSRLHLFATEQRDEIIKSAIEHAGNFIGISLRTRKDPIEFEHFVNLRLGKYSNDESITSLAEFIVQKISPRHTHLFATEQRDEIIKSAIEHAGNFIGISLRTRKDPIEFEHFVNLRLGKYSNDESITSLAEFIVQKISPRHTEPVKRLLALTETCLVERDPATYNIVTLKPLGEIFALVYDPENPQLFTIEFIKGQIRKYSSTERDSLLASLLDGVRASGNRDVCVKMTPTQRGQRWGLLSVPVDEEVESLHLRFLNTPPNGVFADAVFRFNSNISYSGVLHAVTQDEGKKTNKEIKIKKRKGGRKKRRGLGRMSLSSATNSAREGNVSCFQKRGIRFLTAAVKALPVRPPPSRRILVNPAVEPFHPVRYYITARPYDPEGLLMYKASQKELAVCQYWFV